MEQILYSHLDKIAQGALGDGTIATKDLWQPMAYEAGDIKGTMLISGEDSYPEPITLKLNAEGWHRVFICAGNVAHATALELEITGEGKTALEPEELWGYWAPYEKAQEVLFKCMDLTGRDLIINKPHEDISRHFAAAVYYVRLEPMTEQEVAEYKRSRLEKTIQYHFDNDHIKECDYHTAEDYLGRLKMLEHGNGDMLIYETDFDDSNPKDGKERLTYYLWTKDQAKAQIKYLNKREAILENVHKCANDMGMAVYSGFRMAIGGYMAPQISSCWDSEVAKKYPECQMVMRDGTRLPMLSYAYPEARAAMIERIVTLTPDYFEGVSLFFHRLPFSCAFEQPVLDEIQKRFGVDGRLLPMSDPRWFAVASDIVTSFVKELKQALNQKAQKADHAPYKINIITLITPKKSEILGLDLERLCREGLIDSFSQGLMDYWEDLDGCLNADGLIDLDKYVEKKKTDYVIKRYFGDHPEFVTDGLEQFLCLSDKYGMDFYAALPWQNKDAAYFLNCAKALYEKGAKKLICWNANHVARKPKTLEAVKWAGDKNASLNRQFTYPGKTVKITSVNGNDISVVDMHWQG